MKTERKGKKMGKEKRRFKRFDAFMNVHFRSRDSKSIKGSGLTKDLSREGIKVNTIGLMKEGEMVDLVIHVPDDTQPIRTTGKVVWRKSCSGRDQGTDYGVSFLMMDPVDKFRALDYAYNYWLETKVNDFSDPEKVTELS